MGIKVNKELEAKILGLAGVVDTTPPAETKFGNTRVEFDSKRFDSKKERDRYMVLAFDQQKGRIRGLRDHVAYVLEVNGVKIADYEADFVYLTPDGRTVVEDVKSDATRRISTYRMKKRLMLALYGIEVVEV